MPFQGKSRSADKVSRILVDTPPHFSNPECAMKLFHHVRPMVLLGVAVAVTSLVSCASGPSYAEMKSKLPPVAKGQGRVFVYRTSSIGAAVQPQVKIDDQVVGTSMGQGFFYTDQSAGTHEVSIATEAKYTAPVNVQAGQPSYVECRVQMGVLVGRIVPSQVDATIGEANIQSCKMGAK